MRRWMFAACVAVSMLVTPAARAVPREVRVPLVDGQLRLSDLTAAAARKLRLPAWAEVSPDVALDVRGMAGTLAVRSLNHALGEGCQIKVDGDAAIVRVDPEKLPRSVDEGKAAVRDFTAHAAPDATAAQNRFYGLRLPRRVDPAKPLVVLVHGLDSDRANWVAMTQLLTSAGHQPALFTYPSDQPIVDSAAYLGQNLAALRATFPATPVHVIAHSMGGLVARAFVEGDDYAANTIDRLILIGPPNHGSKWAKFRLILEAEEHYHLWRHEPSWWPSWMITDGLGEAGRDLKPKSKFLAALNARQRREGVRYTIIAGDRHEGWRVTGDLLAATGDKLVPDKVEHKWGFRHLGRGVDRWTDKLRDKKSKADGPVTVKSARLDGVDDFVVLHADHDELYLSVRGEVPAAWDVVRDRLARSQ
ncbi:MAG TPA: alpha/beta fold hydrolase [Tepidisphaeraceae bacterium]|nr:alpha/beta fold hydrolase [Tepidisphaeraceae bacterium]